MKISFAAILFSTTFACNKQEEKIVMPKFELATPDEMPDEEYEIFSALANHFTGDVSQIVIHQKTNTSLSINIDDSLGYLDPVSGEIVLLDLVTINLFNEQNSDAYFLDQYKFSTEGEITLITDNAISYIFSKESLQENIERFNEVYPNAKGVYQFSRPSINTENNSAIIYASWNTGGSLFYLEKIDDEWSIVNSFYAWIT